MQENKLFSNLCAYNDYGCGIDLSGTRNWDFLKGRNGVIRDFGLNRPIFCFNMDGQKYYQKFVYDKEESNAEVLLSQVYHKAGFDTARYLPLKVTSFVSDENYARFLVKHWAEIDGSVVSQDISMQNTQPAYQFFGKIFENAGDRSLFPLGIPGAKYADYFTKNGMRQYLKMRIFDTATFNTDRGLDNFLVSLNDEGKVDDVVLYDYGASSVVRTNGLYKNLSGDCQDKTRAKIVEQFRENEDVQSFVTPNELAGDLKSVDVGHTAQTLTNAFGYDISSDFAMHLKQGIEETIEALEQ